MRIIGLTGGIGTGKSTASDYLKDKGLLVLDADQISRDLTKENGEALPKIREVFGDSVFFLDGTLDRKKLGNIVFNNPTELEKLKEITTYVVNRKIVDSLNCLKEKKYDGIVILDVPLLFETHDEELCDEIWVVTCDKEERINRILSRDNLNREEILSRINSQLSEEEKIKRATYVIDNSKDLDYLYSQIDDLIYKK